MTENTETVDRVAVARQIVAHASGGDAEFRHPLDRTVRYTTGMHALASALDAWWLVDLITSHQPNIKRNNPQHADFQVWTLEYMECALPDRHWVANAWSDTPNESTPLASQSFGYSDFPKALLPFTEIWVERGLILLKGEH